jgi:hypothetical protein
MTLAAVDASPPSENEDDDLPGAAMAQIGVSLGESPSQELSDIRQEFGMSNEKPGEILAGDRQ